MKTRHAMTIVPMALPVSTRLLRVFAVSAPHVHAQVLRMAAWLHIFCPFHNLQDMVGETSLQPPVAPVLDGGRCVGCGAGGCCVGRTDGRCVDCGADGRCVGCGAGGRCVGCVADGRSVGCGADGRLVDCGTGGLAWPPPPTETSAQLRKRSHPGQ